MDENLTDMI